LKKRKKENDDNAILLSDFDEDLSFDLDEVDVEDEYDEEDTY
jgi:hypothetical protein